MYKTILFDFDGTVFDTGEGIMKSVRYAAEELGYEAEPYTAYRSFVGPPLGAAFMKKFGADEARAKELIAKYRERYSVVGLTECAPYPGVEALVREIRATGRIAAVATGKPTEFTKKILSANGMGDLFDAVLGSEFDGRRGQKWEVISELLERFGSSGAVMVGDRDNDVLGAKACAIPCIGVAWGYAVPGELESAGAIAVAKDVSELRNLLLG